jgi:hypothetical protein
VSNKRSHDRLMIRIKVEAEVEYSADSALPVGKHIDCETRDLSLTGLCIHSTEQLFLNSRLLLAVAMSPPEPIFKHLAQVVWCRESDDGYLVGLHVTKYLSDEKAWKTAVINYLAG